MIAHAGKSLGEGLPALRRALRAEGVSAPGRLTTFVEAPSHQSCVAPVLQRLRGQGGHEVADRVADTGAHRADDQHLQPRSEEREVGDAALRDADCK